MCKQWLIVIHIGVSLYRFIIYILHKSVMVGGCNGVTVSYLGQPKATVIYIVGFTTMDLIV